MHHDSRRLRGEEGLTPLANNLRPSGALLIAMLALGCVAAADVLSARRERIAQMSPEQKQTLLENQQRLEKLEPDEQRRLREFAAALEQDADAQRLREIMLRYTAWVQRLPVEKRSELLQLAGDARLTRIKLFMSQESRQAAERLSPQDAKVVAAWIEHRIMETVAPEQRARLEQAPDAERHRMIGRLVWQRTQQPGMGHGIGFRPTDLQNLGDKLSSTARRQLLQSVEDHRASQLVGDWIRQALGISAGPPRGGMPQRGGGDGWRFFQGEGGDRASPQSPGKDTGRGPRHPPAQPRPRSDDTSSSPSPRR